MEILASVLAGFALAILAPVIHRIAPRAIGWIVAILPLGLFVLFARRLPAIAAGEIFEETHAWVPGLGVDLAFRLDGLSLLFVLLITGIGSLVMVYAGGYLRGHLQLGRFYLYILAFMASMLGAVLSNNLLALFVFWEITSVTSYLLIGFSHAHEDSRKSALQALLVTGAGGLALLAGALLLGNVAGSLRVSDVLASGDVVRAHPLYGAILGLVLLAAFTKSAQFPFHFWLPGAMAAPTPVSAYLHSATMVKLGIYLLARLAPALGGTDAWIAIVTTAGATTAVIGAYLALKQSDLKLVLAYSTVSALGIITLLLGLSTPIAAKAFVVFLLAHALYKGALFMAAGAIDHETGTRNLDRLRGLRTVMPITAGAAIVAAMSLAGLAPLLSFIGKELLFEALLETESWTLALVAAIALGSMMLVAVAGIVGFHPFFGDLKETPKPPHEAPVSLLLGPVILAGASLGLGIIPDALGEDIVAPAVFAITGSSVKVSLALWHGINPMLILSVITLAGGIAIYKNWISLHRLQSALQPLMGFGPSRAYDGALAGMMRFASWQTRTLQTGYLRHYIAVTLAVFLVAGFATLLVQDALPPMPDVSGIRIHHVILVGVLVAAALATVLLQERLAAIVSLGVVGYAVAVLYLLFGAPDLAITQLLIETLTVLLFILVLARMPRFEPRSTRSTRLRDAGLSAGVGALMTVLVLGAVDADFGDPISAFFAEVSVPIAHGRNIVNVILVDFRGLDTFGEITVLGIAAAGVFALLRAGRRSDRDAEVDR